MSKKDLFLLIIMLNVNLFLRFVFHEELSCFRFIYISFIYSTFSFIFIQIMYNVNGEGFFLLRKRLSRGWWIEWDETVRLSLSVRFDCVACATCSPVANFMIQKLHLEVYSSDFNPHNASHFQERETYMMLCFSMEKSANSTTS